MPISLPSGGDFDSDPGLQSAGKLKDAPFPVGVQEDRQYHASPAIGRAGRFLFNAILFRKAAHSTTISFRIELRSPPVPLVRSPSIIAAAWGETGGIVDPPQLGPPLALCDQDALFAPLLPLAPVPFGSYRRAGLPRHIGLARVMDSENSGAGRAFNAFNS